MALILASASPRRQELLALLTPHFTVECAEVDERAITRNTPQELVQALAEAKCHAVAVGHLQDCVIGCDTVVDVDGTVLGKPADRAQARCMLGMLSGRAHLVHTGVCISRRGQQLVDTVTTRVFFSALTPQELEAYIATEDPYDKAGGYGVQSGAARFVRRIEGCYYNVMGFPLNRVYTMLKQLGETENF